MSSELQDEVEALNSIYGDETLVPADEPNIFVLNLPGEAQSSIRINFPDTYPDAPPEVLNTTSSGGASRGAASTELQLFRQAVGTAFQPGMVCLYDAIEELARLLESQVPTDSHIAEAAEQDEGPRQEFGISTLPEPPWTLSDPITELKSTFVARVAPVRSPVQASSFLQHLLATDRKVRQATHNITAWRIKGENGTSFQDCDDDGETAAGSRLLHLMQVMDLWGVMVVVTRWYGGQKLGPRRFAVINNVARDGFVKAGFVKDVDEKKKGK